VDSQAERWIFGPRPPQADSPHHYNVQVFTLSGRLAFDPCATREQVLKRSQALQGPVDMSSKLAEYDGSVIAERTKGELSARCGGTSMNFVAINLAHEIITGRRTVAEARDEYTRLYTAFERGEKPAYTQGFQFSLPNADTKDLDVTTIS
jgi:hypothetical protein